MAEERSNKIKQILQFYEPKKVNKDIINKIHKLYPKTKHYKYIEPHELFDNILICTVTLDFKKLHIIGRCIKLFYNKNIVEKALLYNPYKKLYWYINPYKYYIFHATNNKELNFNQLIDDYKNTVFKK